MSNQETVREAWQVNPYFQKTKKGANMARKRKKKAVKLPQTLREAWLADVKIRKIISQDLRVRTGLADADRQKAEEIIGNYPKKE